MRKVLAIARLTLVAALRSKMVLTMLLLLAAAVWFLPRGLRSDGTIHGEVRLLVQYSLNAVMLLLSIATVWAGCAAVSTEVRDCTIQLTLCKPVHRLQLWFGKWLGLVWMNLVYILTAGLIVFFILNWRINKKLDAGLFSEEAREQLESEIFVARRVSAPPIPDLREEAREEFKKRQDEGKLDSSLSIPDQVRQLARTLQIRAFTVDPQQRKSWTVTFPELPGENVAMELRYSFRAGSPLGDQQEIQGVWSFDDPNGEKEYAYRTSHLASGKHTVPIPPQAINTATKSVTLSYWNVHPGGFPILFEPEGGIELLYNTDSFGLNYLRAMLILFCQLAFLAALAVTAGTLFGMPVATFCSVVFISLLGFNRMIQSVASQGQVRGFDGNSLLARIANPLIDGVYRGVAALMKPLQQTSPLDLVSSGELVSWGMVWHNVLIRMGVYSSLLCLLGWWVFRNREVGKAQ